MAKRMAVRAKQGGRTAIRRAESHRKWPFDSHRFRTCRECVAVGPPPAARLTSLVAIYRPPLGRIGLILAIEPPSSRDNPAAPTRTLKGSVLSEPECVRSSSSH
jgi:hypothetical protein